MELEQGDKFSMLSGDIAQFAAVLGRDLEGRKYWTTPQRLRFETTAHNLRVVRSLFPDTAAPTAVSEQVARQPAAVVPRFRMTPRPYQLECFERFKTEPYFALFSEPGTGKTKTAFDIVCHRFLSGTLTGVLVFSSPKGVHAQWIEEQLPKHLWSGIDVRAAWWNGRRAPEWLGNHRPGALHIYSLNIDALRSNLAFASMMSFCRAHSGKLMIVVDESDSIKSWSAKRSRRLRTLADQFNCRQRVIMTGTPIAKDLTDEWSQFYFLNPDIIGHRYKTSFLREYCIMGGFENREVIGHRNLDRFKTLTSPYIFRAMKDELNLPEKVYDSIEFDLSDTQRKMLRELKETAMAQLEGSGDTVRAAHGAAALLRMQQIVNGFTVTSDPDSEDTELHALSVNPRIDALRELLSHLRSEHVVIWCRFNFDVAAVYEMLKPEAVRIYGQTPDAERLAAKQRFLADPDVRYLVASPETAGKGMDGLQEVCSHAIYYSNSFSAIARWQSEDRIHRLGTTRAAMYYDLIARGSPDRLVLRNLRDKKSLSTMVLDDVKAMLKEIE